MLDRARGHTVVRASDVGGEKCEEETGAPISHFRVPRGSGDKDFYRLPFPNDIRMKGGHPDLSGHPSPGSELLGFDPVDRYLRAIEAENDGFGPYSTVFFRFNTAFDFTHVEGKSSLTYVDVTKGDAAYGSAEATAGCSGTSTTATTATSVPTVWRCACSPVNR